MAYFKIFISYLILLLVYRNIITFCMVTLYFYQSILN